MKLVKKILDYIFPNRCLSCKAFVQEKSSFCSDCWDEFHFIKEPYCYICSYQLEKSNAVANQVCLSCMKSRPSFEFARCLLKYDESSKKLIHNLKYYDNTNLAKPLSKMLITKYIEDIQDIDIVIPVPMNRFKRIKRLYNHAQLIAEEVSRLIGKKARSDILLKVKNTKPQTVLSKENRLKNLAGSMSIAKGQSIQGKKILLIDDVMTTGSTAEAASKLLKKEGAKSVILLCIARRML